MKKYDTIEVVEKFNPHHDSLGRFASAGGGAGAAASGGGKKTTAAGESVKKPSKMTNNEITSEMIANRQKMKDADGKEHRTLRYRNQELRYELNCRTDPDARKTPPMASTKDPGKMKYKDMEKEIAENKVKLKTATGSDRQNLMLRNHDLTTEMNERNIQNTKKSADIDDIEVVEKFNPFHDSRGRFSNKNGFASYSANPNTKAGAMAIARSAAAGHGKTMNVHRESYGENIRQNANWLGHNNYNVGPRQTGNGTLTQRVEPKNGLAGASAHGYVWQYYNRLNNRTTGQNQPKQPQKPAPAKQTQTQQQQQNPAQQSQQQAQTPNQQSLANHVANVQLRQGDKIAIAPRDALGRSTNAKTIVKNNNQARVKGRDISDSVDLSQTSSSKEAIDRVAELQGWNKAPTVTDNLEVFQKATKQSGQLLVRTVHRDYGTSKSSVDVCKDTMGDGDAALGGGGARAYGGGMYMVGATVTGATGRALGQTVASAQSHSYGYGDAQMMATVHPSAKIATASQAQQMRTDFWNMPSSKQAKYGYDYGAYIASKGYDGAQWHSRQNPYITMYNKSAMIFYAGVVTN